MKKTKIYVALFCLILAIASFGLAACGGESAHHFSETWTITESEHYHKCTDEGCTEVSDRGSHDYQTGGGYLLCLR